MKIMEKTLRAQLLAPVLATAMALTVLPNAGVAQEPEPSFFDVITEEEAPSFDSAEALVEAFVKTMASNDLGEVAALLGLDAERLKADEGAQQTFVAIREGLEQKFVVVELPDRIILDIGRQLWPFPFPGVKGEDGKWSFDTVAGLEEVINRRVGRNELVAIETAREYVEAQQLYALADRDADGVLEYAQKIVSTEGTTDGLFWPPSEDAGVSPAGGFADQETIDKALQGEGYFGYRFRVLTGQGPEIAGGSYDYVINGNMIAGFALIAWPVEYAETGVHTFMVSHHGTVYETDLGPETETIVKYITSFNPDDSWSVVGDE